MIRYAPGDKVRLKENDQEGFIHTATIDGAVIIRFPGGKDYAALETEVEPVLCPSASYLAQHLEETVHKMYGETFDYSLIKSFASLIHTDMQNKDTKWK